MVQGLMGGLTSLEARVDGECRKRQSRAAYERYIARDSTIDQVRGWWLDGAVAAAAAAAAMWFYLAGVKEGVALVLQRNRSPEQERTTSD